MRHMFDGAERDESGILILGNPRRGCEFCGQDVEPTYSGCGRVAWWHPPLDCCKERRHLQIQADRAYEREREQERARAAHHAHYAWRPA